MADDLLLTEQHLKEKIANLLEALLLNLKEVGMPTRPIVLKDKENILIWVDQILALIKDALPGLAKEWGLKIEVMPKAGYLSPEQIRDMFVSIVGGYSKLAELLGYVKLAKDQTFPVPSLGRPHSAYECFKELVKAGWRKLEIGVE